MRFYKGGGTGTSDHKRVSLLLNYVQRPLIEIEKITKNKQRKTILYTFYNLRRQTLTTCAAEFLTTGLENHKEKYKNKLANSIKRLIMVNRIIKIKCDLLRFLK